MPRTKRQTKHVAALIESFKDGVSIPPPPYNSRQGFPTKNFCGPAKTRAIPTPPFSMANNKIQMTNSEPQQSPKLPHKITFIRTLKFFLVIILFIIPLLYFLPTILTPALKTNIQNQLEKTLRTKVYFEDINLNLFTRRIAIKGLTIKNPSQFGEEILLETKQTEIKLSIIALLLKKIVISSIVIDKPHLNLYKLKTGEKNIDPLWVKEDSPRSSPAIMEILIKNGLIHYTVEQESGKKAAAEIRGAFIYLLNNIVPQSHIHDIPLYTEVKAHGYFPSSPKGTIDILGYMNIYEKQKSFLGSFSLENISLTYFNSFYPEDSQVHIMDGTFSSTAQVQCLHDQLLAKPEVTVKNLRLEIKQNYTTGNLFKLPVLLVVDFFDLYKEELKFSFEIDGSLDNPEFHLEDVIKQKVSEIISESIVRTISVTPGLLEKLGKRSLSTLKQLGKPFEEFIKGFRE